MIYYVATQRRTQRGADDNTQAVNGLRHTAFFGRIAFGNNGLRGN